MRKRWLVFLGIVAGTALTFAVTEPRLFFSGAAAVPAARNLQVLEFFVGAFEQVRRHYVEKPEDASLIRSAINGMLSSLEDSSFAEAKSLVSCTGLACPSLASTGIELTMADGLPQVVSPIDDSPAAKAGVMAHDVLIQIDDEPTQGLPRDEIVEKLRGAQGKEVRLKIVRPGRDEPIELKFPREFMTKQSVRARKEGGDIGYIRINQFHENTADELKKVFSEGGGGAGLAQLKGFVLDLRNNPGGLTDTAISVADEFLDSGEIVSLRGRKASRAQSFHATPGDLAGGKPLVVLINAGSASAAEIVAGALKDNHRATIVGTRSFGKAVAVTIIPLNAAHGILRLTTGHYLTPAGHQISGDGITPDVEVLQDLPAELRTGAKAATKGRTPFQSYIPPDPTADKALTLAYDILRGTKTAH
jgi:carboxyl-terminal processing protease